ASALFSLPRCHPSSAEEGSCRPYVGQQPLTPWAMLYRRFAALTKKLTSRIVSRWVGLDRGVALCDTTVRLPSFCRPGGRIHRCRRIPERFRDSARSRGGIDRALPPPDSFREETRRSCCTKRSRPEPARWPGGTRHRRDPAETF